MEREAIGSKIRKRKAENQDNERLSKRLSLLNLERNGQKLYVPVEQPTASNLTNIQLVTRPQNDDIMQVDDTKHKVYIYDLDAELSDSESSDDGKLVFLPDIEKHLRETRIPPSILANSDGELAGNTQLVLYNIPSSLTLPEEKDSVRKAIIETRARARARTKQNMDQLAGTPTTQSDITHSLNASNLYNGLPKWTPSATVPVAQDTMDLINGASYTNNTVAQGLEDYDSDAMDLG